MLSLESPEVRSGQLLEKYICQLTPETVTATKRPPKIDDTCLVFFFLSVDHLYVYVKTSANFKFTKAGKALPGFIVVYTQPSQISVCRDFSDLMGDRNCLFSPPQTLGHLEKAVVLELTLKHVKALTNLIDQQQQKIIALQSGLQAGECCGLISISLRAQHK